MTIEDAIYGRLKANTKLKSKLAQFNKAPAVFFQEAPSDAAAGWGEIRYPRTEYVIDMTANPERHSSGTLTVDVFSTEDGTLPEEIEPIIRATLNGLLIENEDGRVYAIAWGSTAPFEVQEGTVGKNPERKVIGISDGFNLIGLTKQNTQSPDPIEAFNMWAKAWAPDNTVVGLDGITASMMPSDDQPAIYCRITRSETEYETMAVSWIISTLQIHVIGPTPEGRMKWTRHLYDSLADEGEITMLDGSPMIMQRVTIDNSADFLITGQITARVRYGILRQKKYAHPLNHKNITEETKNGE